MAGFGRTFGGSMRYRHWVICFDGLGVVRFAPSTDHTAVMSYELRVYQMGTTTLVATRDIGKPAPDYSGDIRHNLSSLLTPLAAGNYTVKAVALSSGVASAESTGADFSLPLA